jgi:beta-glucanase (GH16 family)
MRNVGLFRASILAAALIASPHRGSTEPDSVSRNPSQVAAPIVSMRPALAGAKLVSMSSATAGATIRYTIDGSAPTLASAVYFAPLLVASNLTVKAYSTLSGAADSSVTTEDFSPQIARGTLVWSDEFSNATPSSQQPDPSIWTYDTGNRGFGNHELENYCAWGSFTPPCDAAKPNAYVGTDGVLHIIARQVSKGVFTSARIKSQGLFSFQYGRIEARMKLPESQGMWPAFWTLGSNIATVNWPACGELDIMEHIDGSNPAKEGFDWVQGSIHGTGLDGGIQYHPVVFSATDWHTYGMIWSKGQIQYYVDSPANIYASFSARSQKGTWPFDSGPQFLLLNLAVGGSWPGNPDATTVFPSSILVDYVRIYTN